MKKLSECEFLEKANLKHDNKFDYSQMNYVNGSVKIKIICPEHGEFWQRPNDHLSGYGCLQCGIKHQSDYNKLTINEFIKKSKDVHGDKYNYSKVNYINSITKVEIICNKHGSFWQIPANHLMGVNCPKCRCSKGEEKIRSFLLKSQIKFDEQKTFTNCKSESGRKLRFDFYIPSKNLCIEYDGQQHFRKVNWNSKIPEKELTVAFEKVKINDEIKNQFCKENSINLLRISYTEFNNIDSILNNYFNG